MPASPPRFLPFHALVCIICTSCASCSFTDGSISLELQRYLQKPCTYGYLAVLVLRDSSLRRDGLDFASLALTLALASISTLSLPLPSRLAFLRIKVTLAPLLLRFAAPFDFVAYIVLAWEISHLPHHHHHREFPLITISITPRALVSHAHFYHHTYPPA